MRLPAFPPPDLTRLFGSRTAPPSTPPRTTAVLALRRDLGLEAVPAAAVRWALTDPGWCNEAQTPAWRPPWPPNTELEAAGVAALEPAGLDPVALGAHLDTLGAWEALFLAPGQQHLPARGRARILARSAAALVAVGLQHGVSLDHWAPWAAANTPRR